MTRDLIDLSKELEDATSEEVFALGEAIRAAGIEVTPEIQQAVVKLVTKVATTSVNVGIKNTAQQFIDQLDEHGVRVQTVTLNLKG